MASIEKIKVVNPIVELDGDEMTRIAWAMIKEQLLFPYLDIPLEYYDLHLKHRDETDDKVTTDAAKAVLKYGVGVKCATITPNEDRIEEYKLKKTWKSPNGTIRGILDGTVFRAPIMVKNVKPANRNWKKPIHIGRHAYGDVYANQEITVDVPGRAEIAFYPEGGSAPVRKTIKNFSTPGILQGIHNMDDSIRSFAKTCFTYGYDQKVDVWFSAKDTISKIYDTKFRDIFNEEYETKWKKKYESKNLTFFYTLIDDVVARMMKTEGGILWACKNYDGDVMSDMLASAHGSLALMTSVLVSPKNCFMYEAAHGTVQRHYYKHLKGEKTSTNPTALIFAWTGCLKKRGELDATTDVTAFGEKLEESVLETIETGTMTGDLVNIAEQNKANKLVNMEDFIEAINIRLKSKLC